MTSDKPEKKRSLTRPNDWTDVLAPEIISQFLGKHIAIVYKRVVASGTSTEAVFEECLKLFPDETPYMAYIPTPEEARDEEFTAAAMMIADDIEIPTNPFGFASPSAVQPVRTTAATQPPSSRSGTGIRSFLPKTGPVGTIVTINGGDFSEAEEVMFGNTPATTFTLLSDNAISVAVPIGASSDVIAVHTAAAVLKSKDRFVVLQPPTIRSFSPAKGRPGTKITVHGAFHGKPSAAAFDGAEQKSFVSVSESSVTFELPVGAKTGTFSITTGGGSTWSQGVFTVLDSPEIHSIQPADAAVGDTIEIHGSGLIDSRAVSVGGADASQFTVVSDSLIQVSVPEGATSGDIVVLTQAGPISVAAALTIIPRPMIDNWIPRICPVGDYITVQGRYFNGATDVLVGGVDALEFSVNSDEVIVVRVPEGAVNGAIEVVTAGGTAKSGDNFSTVPAPVVLSFSPPAAATGSVVTINGSNFLEPLSITFKDVEAPDFSLVTSDKIDVKVPIAAESGPISVKTIGGTGVSTDKLTVIPVPVIKSFTPTADGIGAKVMLTGAHLSGASSVRFNGAESAKFTVISSSFISAEVPHNATTGPISVTTLGGSVTSVGIFTVIAPPTVTAVSPIAGPAGTKVTITGEHLSDATRITLNQLPIIDFEVGGTNTINLVIPDDAVNGTFRVFTPGGAVESETSFTVVPLPMIDSFAPAFGPAGTVITVHGRNLDRANVAYINSVRANISAVGGSKAKIFVPGEATSGIISIMTPFGLCESSAPFEVISASSIKDVTPSSGIAGSFVTIHGWGFKSATDVLFGGVPSQSVTINSNNSITAQIPYGAQSGDITVSGTSGSVIWAKPFTVTFSIVDVHPSFGPVGTPVTINGVGFTGSSAVAFAGVKAEFRATSNNAIRTRAPVTGIDGRIQVTTPRGSTLSPRSYYYPPLVVGFNPLAGPPGTLVAITLSKNVDLAIEDCEVEFANGQRVAPESVNELDHIVFAAVPNTAVTGPIKITTPGGTAESNISFTLS